MTGTDSRSKSVQQAEVAARQSSADAMEHAVMVHRMLWCLLHESSFACMDASMQCLSAVFAGHEPYVAVLHRSGEN